MAETASARIFWRTWALAGLVGAVIAGARFMRSPHALKVAPNLQIAAKAQTSPRIEVEVVRAEPVADALFARLATAETGRELCELVQRLPASDDPAATYAITAVLERAHFRSVRACATIALTEQPTPEAQSWLIDLASDPDPDVHDAALHALAASGDGSAQADVLEATHSEDADIRASAVVALLEAKSLAAFPAAVELLRQGERRETLCSLVDALGKSHDPRALPVLASLVAHADSETHLHAISALGELAQEKAEPLLRSLLEVGSDDEYRAAAQALVQLSPERALAEMRVTLRSTNGSRRALALTALVESDLPDVATELGVALRGGDARLARVALQHLAQKPDASFEGEITTLVGQEDSGVQRLALRALARLHTPSALATLERLTNSEALGSWARRELDRVPSTPEEARTRHLHELEQGEVSALNALAEDPGDAAQAAILSYFSSDPETLVNLASVVRLAPPSTVERLVSRTNSAAVPARLALVDGLVARGDPRFVSLLRASAHDDADPDVRRSALRGLVQLGDEESTSLLGALVDAPEASDRSFAAETLGASEAPSALPMLEKLAGDADESVATAALKQLLTRAPERAVVLANQAYDAATPEARPELLSALGDLRSGLAMPLYDRALEDKDENVVSSGVRALGDVQGPASASRLLAVLRDENRSQTVRADAALALRGLGGPLVRENSALLAVFAPMDTTEGFQCNAE